MQMTAHDSVNRMQLAGAEIRWSCVKGRERRGDETAPDASARTMVRAAIKREELHNLKPSHTTTPVFDIMRR